MQPKHEGLHSIQPTLWHIVVIALWIADVILDGGKYHDARRDELVRRLDTPGKL